MRLFLLLLLLFVGGCRLSDLLNPGPPPEEEICYATLRMTWVNSDDDTTVITRRGVRVECPPDTTSTP